MLPLTSRIVEPRARKQPVLAETGGYGADVVIECVGHPDAVNEGLEYCRDGARFLCSGNTPTREISASILTRSLGSSCRLPVRGALSLGMWTGLLRLLDATDWKQLFARTGHAPIPLGTSE